MAGATYSGPLTTEKALWDKELAKHKERFDYIVQKQPELANSSCTMSSILMNEDYTELHGIYLSIVSPNDTDPSRLDAMGMKFCTLGDAQSFIDLMQRQIDAILDCQTKCQVSGGPGDEYHPLMDTEGDAHL